MFNFKKIRKSGLISIGAIVVAAVIAAADEFNKQKEQEEMEQLKIEHEELKTRVKALEESEE